MTSVIENDVTRPRTIAEVMDQQASRYSNRVFLLSAESGETCSFSELREYGRLLAHTLMNRGVESQAYVGILMENSVEAAKLFLGLMYAGYVPTPLNPHEPADRLNAMLLRAEVSHLFVSGPFSSVGEELESPSLTLLRAGDLPDYATEGPTPPEVRPDHEAVLDFTSGSTGQPKGVLVTHQGLLAGAANTVAAHELTDQDRSLCLLPLYHMNAQVITLLPTLLSGGGVVMLSRFTPDRFWSQVTEQQCTWFALVPSMISQLLTTTASFDHIPKEQLARIRFARSSSAALPPAHHQRFETTFGLPLLEAMGSTEAGSVIFSNPLPPAPNKVGSPGIPFGFEVNVVDSAGAPLPAGECGILTVKGPSLMKGYLGDDDATREVLKDGWLTVGDAGYLDQDGYVFLTGRTRELIIKGGENISPTEIDEVVYQHPDVLEACAVGVPDTHLGEEIELVVVPVPGRSIIEKEILDHCRDRLGVIKTPKAIHLFTDVPKGPSGKILRSQVRERVMALTRECRVKSPSSRKERARAASVLSSLWTEILQTPSIEANDHFFLLGGDSLAAMNIAAQFKTQTGIGLNISDFFETPRFGDLVEKLEDSPSDKPPFPFPVERGRDEPAPLTDIQQRIWFFDQFSPGTAAYIETQSTEFHGELDPTIFREGIEWIIRSHDILRASFELRDDRPVEIVHDAIPNFWEEVDLSDEPEEVQQERIQELTREIAIRPFDLGQPGLIRAQWIQRSTDQHIFTLVMHHLICDRWTYGLFTERLQQYYSYRTLGTRLPEQHALQHGDIARWAQDPSQHPLRPNHLAYWRNRLAHLDNPLPMPLDHPRPETFSFRGKTLILEIGAPLVEKAKETTHSIGTTLFSQLTAGVALLLHRCSEQTDLALGIPLANRETDASFNEVFGPMVDTQVFRSTVGDDTTFAEFLHQTHLQLAEGYRHRNAPFHEVISSLDLEPSLASAPLFQTMVNWQAKGTALWEMNLPGIQTGPQFVEPFSAKFDMGWAFSPTEKGIRCSINFCTDLYSEQTIRRFFDMFQNLLLDGLHHDQVSIWNLKTQSEEEAYHLRVTRNQTEMPFPRDETLLTPFERFVQEAPHRLAVTGTDVATSQRMEWSYRDLNEEMLRWATILQANGITKGNRVAILLPICPTYIALILGILKTGAAYLPIDISFPHDRIQFLLRESGTKLLIAEPQRFDVASDICPVIGHQEMAPEVSVQDITSVGSDDAYVLYTSGSTGKPNGVAVKHAAVANWLYSLEKRYDDTFSAEDRILSTTSPCFDVSVIEFFLPLFHGASLHLMEEHSRMDVRQISKKICDEQITFMTPPPAFLDPIREELETRSEDAALSKILTGVEAISSDVLDAYHRLLPGVRIVNGYGPTECTISSIQFTHTAGSVPPGEPVPIGTPLANSKAWLLDQRGELVPEGLPGEIYLGGEGVTDGYINRPALTAERFVSIPQLAGERLYKTGDIARWTGGQLHFIGRRDRQIKLRGFRIELDEIESAIRQHSSVSETAVLCREDRPGDKRLVAYLVLEKKEWAQNELNEFLAQRLPRYMIPAHVVILEQLPMTPSGKIDRKRLPEPDQSLLAPEAADPPANATEEKLAQLWKEVLGTETPSVTDDFFLLGGNSLLAVTLTIRIEKEFGVPLPLATLFEESSIRGVGRLISKQDLSSEVGRYVLPIQVETDGPPFFCVHPLSGNILCYRELGNALKGKHSLYGIQAPGLREGEETIDTIEELARAYIEQIREIQPEGPYHIGGMCMGGMVAFEIARQLKEAGDGIGMVALLDTAFGTPKVPQRSPFYYAVRVVHHLREAQLIHIVRETLRQRKRRRNKQAHRSSQRRNAGKLEPQDRRMTLTRIANETARDHYEHKMYPGVVTYLLAKKGPNLSTKAWSAFARDGLNIHPINCSHPEFLIGDSVKEIADTLSRVIEEPPFPS